MEFNTEKTLWDVKMKQDATWSMAVAIFWLVAAVFLYVFGALMIWFFVAGEIIAIIAWLPATAFGLIGLVKGIRLVWQNWN